MHRTSVGTAILVALACLLFLPMAASAQSAFAGLVRDESGGVLPGVTVEVASPVLIEKVRTGVTDEQGRYRIVDLRPGTYRLTFALTGFSTVVRDGVELPGNFTATVNVDLKVGSLQETVTVSGAAPVVDVQQASRTQVVTREIMDTLPTTRNLGSIGILVPGVRMGVPDVGGSMAMEQPSPRIHGVNNNENTQLLDGMDIRAYNSANNPSYFDDALGAETSVMTSALPADTSLGGLRVNVIPKDGGNTVGIAVFLGGMDGKWQSKNISDRLRARNVSTGNSIAHVQNFNASLGGPIKRDRLWFFMTARHASTDEAVANIPKEIWLPDGTFYRGLLPQFIRDAALRLTLQAGRNHKIAAYTERSFKNKETGLSYGQDVRSSVARLAKHTNYAEGIIKYTGTISSQLMVEAGYSKTFTAWQGTDQVAAQAVRWTPKWYAWAQKTDTALNKNFYPDQCAYLTGCTNMGGGSLYHDNPIRNFKSFAVSYVTGTHNVKVGFQHTHGQIPVWYDRNADLIQVYVNNRPSSVTVYNTPVEARPFINYDIGLYAQDAWTFKRLTVNLGGRVEWFEGMLQEASMGAGRFAPARWFAARPEVIKWGPGWAPRFSVVYDLFGDGYTALKAAISKYHITWTGEWPLRYSDSTQTTDSRQWFDADLIPGTSTISGVVLPTNGDNIAQENEIGPSSNALFGLRADRVMAPDFTRSYHMEYAASVQRQLRPGISVTGAYYHRVYRKVENMDRTLISASDYTSFTLPMPSFANDPTLSGILNPNEVLTIYNLKPQKLPMVGIGLEDRNSSDLSIYDGFEFSFTVRFGQGTVFGGWSVDKNQSVFCEGSGDNPNGALKSDLYQGWQVSDGGRFCDERDFDKPYLHEYKLAGSYLLPFSTSVGAVLQSLPGRERVISWVPAASLFPGGRTKSETIRLSEPGAQYVDRYNQLDINFKKNFRAGRKRYSLQLDLFNALNCGAIMTVNDSIGGSLGNVTRIMMARIPRIAFQFQW